MTSIPTPSVSVARKHNGAVLRAFDGISGAVVVLALVIGIPIILTEFLGKPIPQKIPNVSHIKAILEHQQQIPIGFWKGLFILLGWGGWAWVVIATTRNLLDSIQVKRFGSLKKQGLGFFLAKTIVSIAVIAGVLFLFDLGAVQNVVASSNVVQQQSIAPVRKTPSSGVQSAPQGGGTKIESLPVTPALESNAPSNTMSKLIIALIISFSAIVALIYRHTRKTMRLIPEGVDSGAVYVEEDSRWRQKFRDILESRGRKPLETEGQIHGIPSPSSVTQFAPPDLPEPGRPSNTPEQSDWWTAAMDSSDVKADLGSLPPTVEKLDEQQSEAPDSQKGLKIPLLSRRRSTPSQGKAVVASFEEKEKTEAERISDEVGFTSPTGEIDWG